MRDLTSAFMRQVWRQHLDEIGLEDPGLRLGRQLVARHASPWRRYHGLAHLAFLFREIDTCSDDISDRARLILAAWFHDAIYVSWRKDNEARSARWAEGALPGLGTAPELIARVTALIERTANHAQGGADHDDALFLDMDCAILGAPAAIYDRYARGVRLEYFWAPSGAYRRGRAAFLNAQLAREPLFLAQTFERRYAGQARKNMQRELKRL